MRISFALAWILSHSFTPKKFLITQARTLDFAYNDFGVLQAVRRVMPARHDFSLMAYT